MGKRGGEGKETSKRHGNEKFTAMGNCLLPAGGLQGAMQSMPQHHPTQEERKLEALSIDISPCGPGTAPRGANTLAFLCCSVWAVCFSSRRKPGQRCCLPPGHIVAVSWSISGRPNTDPQHTCLRICSACHQVPPILFHGSGNEKLHFFYFNICSILFFS